MRPPHSLRSQHRRQHVTRDLHPRVPHVLGRALTHEYKLTVSVAPPNPPNAHPPRVLIRAYPCLSALIRAYPCCPCWSVGSVSKISIGQTQGVASILPLLPLPSRVVQPHRHHRWLAALRICLTARHNLGAASLAAAQMAARRKNVRLCAV